MCRNNTSMLDLGNFSKNIAGLSASAVIFDISTDLLSGPGLFRSPTENGAILYLHLIIAMSGLIIRLTCSSLGP